MKRAIFLTFAKFFLLSSLLYAQTRVPRSLLSETAREMISESETILAIELGPMIESPIFMPPHSSGGKGKALSSAQRKILLKHLLTSKELDDRGRFKKCKFKPGIKFSFYPESVPDTSAVHGINAEAPISLLLCLNCNVWALPTGTYLSRETNEPDPQRIGYFGDSQSGEKELRGLFDELFPSHGSAP